MPGFMGPMPAGVLIMRKMAPRSGIEIQKIPYVNRTWLFLKEEAKADGFTPCSQCNDVSMLGDFLGDKRDKIYHDLSCQLVQEIPKYRHIWFSGSADTRICGYMPCRIYHHRNQKFNKIIHNY